MTLVSRMLSAASQFGRLALAATALAALTGCVSSAALIAQDGPRYEVNIDHMARKLHTTIDGVPYIGTAVGNEAVGVGISQSFGLRPTTAMTTMAMSGNNGRALFTSASGDYIECEYMTSSTTLIGKCISNKGRQFVFASN
jgi:hypothetical protein